MPSIFHQIAAERATSTRTASSKPSVFHQLAAEQVAPYATTPLAIEDVEQAYRKINREVPLRDRTGRSDYSDPDWRTAVQAELDALNEAHELPEPPAWAVGSPVYMSNWARRQNIRRRLGLFRQVTPPPKILAVPDSLDRYVPDPKDEDAPTRTDLIALWRNSDEFRRTWLSQEEALNRTKFFNEPGQVDPSIRALFAASSPVIRAAKGMLKGVNRMAWYARQASSLGLIGPEGTGGPSAEETAAGPEGTPLAQAIDQFETWLETTPEGLIVPTTKFEKALGMLSGTAFYALSHMSTGGVTSFAGGFSEAREAAVTAGMTDEQADLVAMPAAILYLMTERLQTKGLVSAGVGTSLRKRTLLEISKRGAANVATRAGTEGIQEGMQKVLTEVGTVIMGPDDWGQLIKDVGWDIAGGALMGFAFDAGGVRSFIDAHRAVLSDVEISEILEAFDNISTTAMTDPGQVQQRLGLTDAEMEAAMTEASELADRFNADEDTFVQAALGRAIEAKLEADPQAQPTEGVSPDPAGADAPDVAVTPPASEVTLPNWESVPDARDAEPADVRRSIGVLLDTWFAHRDVAIARAYVNSKADKDSLKALAAQRGIAPADLDLALLLYTDLRNAEIEGRRDQIEKYGTQNEQQEAALELSQNLTAEEIALAETMSEQTTETGRQAKEAGIKLNLKESYAARLWQPEKEGGGGLLARFRKSTPRARQRTLESILHGWSLDKSLQVAGATDAHLIASQQTAQATQDRNLMLAAEKAGLISPNRPQGFQPIEHPNFTKMQWVGKVEEGKTYGRDVFVDPSGNVFHRQQMTAEPELAKKLNNALGESALRGVPIIDAVTRYNSTLKHTILTTSLFHHQAFLRSFMLASRGVNPIRGFQAGKQAIQNFTPELQQLVAGGLTIGAEMRQNWQQWSEQESTGIGKIIDNIPMAGDAKNKLLALRDQQTDFLFNKLGAYLKAQAGILEYRHLLKKHGAALEAGTMTHHDVAKMAAKVINDDFGGLHLQRMGRNPTVQHIFQLLSLAPDWTESNVRTMAKAFERGDEGFVYRQMWGRVMLKGLGSTVLFNYLMSAFDDDDFVERYQKAWEADHLRWLDVDITPLYRALPGSNPDSRMYFSLIGHFRDPVKFVAPAVRGIFGDENADVLRPAKHKGSVLTRIALDTITGTDWKGREFTSFGELLGLGAETGIVGLTGEPIREPGQLGRLTGKVNIGRGGVGLRELPSLAIYEGRSVLPIPAQNSLSFLTGEMDGWEAALKSLGFMIATEEEQAPVRQLVPPPGR